MILAGTAASTPWLLSPARRENREVRRTIEAMGAGEVRYFDLPRSRIERRSKYRSIGSIAHYAWGPGNYKMQVEDGGLIVRRVR